MVHLTFGKNQSTIKRIVIFSVAMTLVVVFVAGLFFGVKALWIDQTDSIPHDLTNQIINIHFIPHTHDDVGWLKTVDQYYHGQNNTIQKACVQCIIDNVITALEKNPNRKFIYVETAFLWKWWQDRNETQRKILKNLVDEGRLEIIGGGWSMNDEAVTHYQSIIDQFTWGFRRLNEMFGPEVRPKIGWQIDPFGHSREQASIFAQMGFDGLFFARLDHQDKAKRLHEKSTEFIWKGSSSLGESSNLFTSVLFNHYSPPKGFCFDVLCKNVEYITKDNVDEKVSLLLNFVERQANSYKTKNVLLTMGDDFHYENAEVWFENMDKLISHINEKKSSRFKAFYSTPSIYIKHLNDRNESWIEKSDDFFPYSSDFISFWTGYYTSRPTLKFFERLGNNFLQVVKQISVITNQSDSNELNLLREAMGVMQHHDAVTGTERQHVAEDYEKVLHQSIQGVKKIAEKSLNKWIRKNDSSAPVTFNSCLQLNISSCKYTGNEDQFVVTVYNPTSQPLTTYVRIPINGMVYTIRNFAGDVMKTQILSIPNQVLKIPGRRSNERFELVFEAKNIPSLSYQSFYFKVNGNESYNNTNTNYTNITENESISGKFYNISVDTDGNVVVRSKKTNKKLDFKQSFHYYQGMQGRGRSSGAYVFRPRTNETINLSPNPMATIYNGYFVDELHQQINNWISQVVRLYKNKDYIEFEWLVGPIDTSDYIGKEIVTRYSSNLKNAGEFYTDSNGRQMMKRKLNYRPTWEANILEPVAGNYYPITTKISIEDKKENLRLSVLTDRAQGGSSLKDGQLELMLHRRLLYDDGFGVSEPLDENAYKTGLVARGKHYLIGGDVENKDELILREKELAIDLAMRPWIFIASTQYSFEEWQQSYNMQGDIVINMLPKNIRILTLEPWKDGQALLRLEHLFEKHETTEYSKSVEIDLQKLFHGFIVQSVQETILGGNQLLKENQRLKWNSKSSDNLGNKPVNKTASHRTVDSMIVTLNPMEIKTFIVKFSLNRD